MPRPSHVRFMRRALELALKAKGRTSPNPMVGCVIAKQGRLIAEGYHREAGTKHAEIVALGKVTRRQAAGATLYVTMEPCSVYGKTPPCVPQVIESGVKRVAVGARDPNPNVNGRGIAWLKEAGLEVIEGILADECAAINRPFEKFVTQGLPYVTLKVALSLDGKIATADGDSKWISNTLSRRYVHQLRDEVDAILVGRGTLKQDDPLLNVRLPGSKKRKHPTVVVVDSKLDIPQLRKLFNVKNRKLIFATTWMSPEENRRQLMSKGAEVWAFDADLTGRVDLKALLKMLGQRGITHLLVEGGAGIYSSFVSQKLADRIVTFLSPKLLGGQAIDWLPEMNVRHMDAALELTDFSVQTLGDNILLEGRLK